MFTCARLRAPRWARTAIAKRVWMRIRVFPEIVYRFVEFTTCKQSHPNANERVTFTLPPVVVFAHSFRTSIRGRVQYEAFAV